MNTIKDQFNIFEKQINGDSQSLWHALRKEALNHFNDKGFPGHKDEEYKYTHLAKAIEKKFDFSELSVSEKKTVADNNAFTEQDVIKLYVVNGSYVPEASTGIDVKGLEIMSLKEAYKEHSALIDKHLGKHSDYKKDAFIAINTAFSLKGLFIRISKNVVIDKPVLICNQTDKNEKNTVVNQRNLCILEQGAQASVLEYFTSSGPNEHFSNYVSEIVVDKNARLNFYKLQATDNKSYLVDNTQITQFADSLANTFTITLDGAIVRNNLSFGLEEENCESHMYGLYAMKGKTHVDNHTTVDHKKPHCFSNEVYKGILDDDSKGVFNGKIYVRQDAQKTNAFQSNKNILLTDSASINTKPQLEIWADDVKCSHGCTTGQLDEEQLFYLRSRGLSLNSARALLLHAFANDIIDKIDIEFVRDFVNKEMTNRLD